MLHRLKNNLSVSKILILPPHIIQMVFTIILTGKIKSRNLCCGFFWCEQRDLNPYVINTRPSNVPVCQFQHARLCNFLRRSRLWRPLALKHFSWRMGYYSTGVPLCQLENRQKARSSYRIPAAPALVSAF